MSNVGDVFSYAHKAWPTIEMLGAGWYLYVTSALIAILIYAFVQHWQLQSKLGRCHIPLMVNPRLGGKPLPFIGHAINFLRYRPWDLLNEWHDQYGPIVGFNLLGHAMYSLASPELIKVVLQSKIASVKKDVANTMKHFLVILGTGIVTSENEAWMKQRLKMSHPLRYDILETIPAQTLQAVQRWMQQLDEASANNNSNTEGDESTVVPVGSSLRHLTLQVISGSFLSLSAQESDESFAKLYLPIVDESNTRVWHPYRAYLIFLPSFWQYWINVYKLNKYVSHLITTRWQQRQSSTYKRRDDILDKVLDVYAKECCDGDVGMINNKHNTNIPNNIVQQLRDEMKTFMLAGHETSAAMMTWTFYELLVEKSMCRQVFDEAQTVFDPKIDWSTATIEQLPSKDELAKLIYSEACLRESLRKYSVVPIVARRTIQDLPVDSSSIIYNSSSNGSENSSSQKMVIPKGSSVMIHIQAVHHNPQYWPNPIKYDPTRFIDKEIAPYTFLPFIAGPRNCLGQHLALLESKMVLSLITQRYEFSLPPGAKVCTNWTQSGTNKNEGDVYDPRHRFMIPVIPQKELYVKVKRRKTKE